MRILVVDDDKMIRDLAHKILTRAGYEIVEAESGLKAIEIYNSEQSQIDLVILDNFMADFDGIETLYKLREINPYLKCIFSSGSGKVMNQIPDDLQKSTFFLEKPYRANLLLELVESVLK